MLFYFTKVVSMAIINLNFGGDKMNNYIPVLILNELVIFPGQEIKIDLSNETNNEEKQYQGSLLFPLLVLALITQISISL